MGLPPALVDSALSSFLAPFRLGHAFIHQLDGPENSATFVKSAFNERLPQPHFPLQSMHLAIYRSLGGKKGEAFFFQPEFFMQP